MRGLLLTTEALVGGAALIVVLALAATFIRRRIIAQGKPLTVCGLRERTGGRWRFGLTRYGTTGLEWFTLGGFSLRPARLWERGRLNIDPPKALRPGESPQNLIPGALRVLCHYDGATFEMALAQPTYTALRSWLEASPPGRSMNVA